MAQASRRVRQLRRVKRERSQLRQAIRVQQQQLQTVVKMLGETQAELRKVTTPSFTISTLADDVALDDAELTAMAHSESIRQSKEQTHDIAINSDPS